MDNDNNKFIGMGKKQNAEGAQEDGQTEKQNGKEEKAERSFVCFFVYGNCV